MSIATPSKDAASRHASTSAPESVNFSPSASPPFQQELQCAQSPGINLRPGCSPQQFIPHSCQTTSSLIAEPCSQQHDHDATTATFPTTNLAHSHLDRSVAQPLLYPPTLPETSVSLALSTSVPPVIHTTPGVLPNTPGGSAFNSGYMIEDIRYGDPLVSTPPNSALKSRGGRRAANPHMTEEQRRQERVLKNRESAMKSLQKKKKYTQHLENRAAALAARNAELRDKIRLLLLRLNELNAPPPPHSHPMPPTQMPPSSYVSSQSRLTLSQHPLARSLPPASIDPRHIRLIEDINVPSHNFDVQTPAAVALSVGRNFNIPEAYPASMPISSALPASLDQVGLTSLNFQSDSDLRIALAQINQPPPVLETTLTPRDEAEVTDALPSAAPKPSSQSF